MNPPNPPPSDSPIRLAVVGGNFGANIARNLAAGNPFIRLAGICDTDAGKARSLAAELGVPAFTSMDEMLRDDNVEAVGLFTPPARRGELISRILRAGRHVMTTKPFESSLAAAREVLEEAQSAALAVHLNSPAPRPSEDIAQIQRWVAGHQLGQPIGFRAETWAAYREQAGSTWYDDPALCPVAPIFRLGIYFLNDFAALLGRPVSVHSMQTRIFTGRATADNAQVSIQYENGALGHVFASFCVEDGKPYPDHVILNYERGTIRRWVERTGSRDMSGDRARLTLLRPGAPDLHAETSPGAYAGWYDWQTFHQAIRQRDPALLQNRDAILYGVRLIDAMARSASSGLPEKVL